MKDSYFRFIPFLTFSIVSLWLNINGLNYFDDEIYTLNAISNYNYKSLFIHLIETDLHSIGSYYFYYIYNYFFGLSYIKIIPYIFTSLSIYIATLLLFKRVKCKKYDELNFILLIFLGLCPIAFKYGFSLRWFPFYSFFSIFIYYLYENSEDKFFITTCIVASYFEILIGINILMFLIIDAKKLYFSKDFIVKYSLILIFSIPNLYIFYLQINSNILYDYHVASDFNMKLLSEVISIYGLMANGIIGIGNWYLVLPITILYLYIIYYNKNNHIFISQFFPLICLSYFIDRPRSFIFIILLLNVFLIEFLIKNTKYKLFFIYIFILSNTFYLVNFFNDQRPFKRNYSIPIESIILDASLNSKNTALIINDEVIYYEFIKYNNPNFSCISYFMTNQCIKNYERLMLIDGAIIDNEYRNNLNQYILSVFGTNPAYISTYGYDKDYKYKRSINPRVTPHLASITIYEK